MLPDSVPSPKAAEPFEAHLRRFALPEPPATLGTRLAGFADAAPIETLLLGFDLPAPPPALDARVAGLLADAPAHRPGRAFWRKTWSKTWSKTAAFASASGALAAGVALAFLLHAPTARDPVSQPRPEIAVGPGNLPSEAPTGGFVSRPVEVSGYTVPVGYEYAGSRTVYAEETPIGTVTSRAGQPMRAIRRDALERRLYRDPKTQATLEIDAPQSNVILENLPSY